MNKIIVKDHENGWKYHQPSNLDSDFAVFGNSLKNFHLWTISHSFQKYHQFEQHRKKNGFQEFVKGIHFKDIRNLKQKN